MKRLGQHFLKNKSAIEKIVGALEIKNGGVVIEVGPGHGEMTEEIISNLQFSIFNKHSEKIKIFAIEKDEKLIEALREKFSGDKNIEIIEGDALKIIPELVNSLNLKIVNCKLKIVGNIPYYITGHLLRVIGELKNKPELCIFTVQKEVAERITARPPKNNRLAASVQFWSEPQILGYISKNDFLPPPKVDSAIIRLARINADVTQMNADKYYAAVRMLFAQPRQTILNNLYRGTKIPKENLALKLKQINITPEDRPQNLSVENIIKISELLG